MDPKDYRTNPTINYGYGNYNDSWTIGNSRYQPNFSVSNTTTWTKGSHSVRFGGNWYREVNKYWDSDLGYTNVTLGLVARRSGAGGPDQRGHSGGGRSGGSLADRCRMDPSPVALRHVGRADFQLQWPSPHRLYYRQLCGWKHAGPGRGRAK